MASFDDIQTEVIARLGGRTDLAVRSTRWINDAYFELLMHPRFTFNELDKQATTSTINTLKSYDLPSDCWFILDVRDDTNNVKLRKGHWNQFDARSVTYGEPTKYVRFGDSIELDPCPDDAYTLIIRYRKRPTELASGVSLATSREWDELITAMAVTKGWEALEQPDKAVMSRQLVEQLVSTRLDVNQLEDMDAEITIGVRLE